MQQLGNYLSKDKQFVEVGSVYLPSLYYAQKTWTHVTVALGVLNEESND